MTTLTLDFGRELVAIELQMDVAEEFDVVAGKLTAAGWA